MRKEVGRSREKIGYGGLDTEMETVRKKQLVTNSAVKNVLF